MAGLAAALAVAIVAAGCTTGELRARQGTSDVRPVRDCDELVERSREAVERAIETAWSPWRGDVLDDRGTAAGPAVDPAVPITPAAPRGPATTMGRGDQSSAESSAESTAESTAGDGIAGRDPSSSAVIGTNVQERDVDEADLVKTDGRRIVTLTGGVLRVVELDDSPAVDGELSIGHDAHELFLRDDHAVVLGSDWDGFSGTTVTLISLEVATDPTVTSSVTVEGEYVAARMVDGVVRLVVRGEPALMHQVLAAPDERAARAELAAMDVDDLLPRITVDGRVDTLGRCEDVMVLGEISSPSEPGRDPAIPAPPMPAPAIGSVTALTITDTLDDLHPVSIQGAVDTVYASTDSLYLTSSDWGDQGSRTAVHRFSLEADEPASYAGSGAVPGRLLNQFSLSERAGALRVVTTVERPDGTTEARIGVLDTASSTLDEIGHVGGLGVGEEVKSVRFLEDLAYVVTFRQTDPLYALDLSDPRQPRVLGELKIPGFSEYLHPVGDGLLLGVGRQADELSGMDQGFKVSLFDITDPLRMAEVDQIVLGDAWSPVGSDHRAFLWDGGRRQAVVPVEGRGAMVLRVTDGQLEPVAELRHGVETPIRSFVVGAELWTLAPSGLARTSADAPGAMTLLDF